MLCCKNTLIIPGGGYRGFVRDWLGIYHNLTDLPIFPKELDGQCISRLPVPNDGLHAEVIEYFALLTSVEAARKNKYTMLELGAGWGPWMCASGITCKKAGIGEIKLTGVEGEANKIPLIKHHLTKNGLRPDNDLNENTLDGCMTRIINGVVNDGTPALFPVVDISHYGASLIHGDCQSDEMVSVRGYTMEELTKDDDIVDLVHIDIQGYEKVLLEEQIRIFQDKVLYIAIGTHTRAIEGFLIEFMLSHGFVLLREQPCLISKPNQLPQNPVDMTIRDGMQVWKNNTIKAE